MVRSRYRRLWVIGRTLASDEGDQKRAYKLMRRYTLTPLKRLGKRISYPKRKLRRAGQGHYASGLAFLDALQADEGQPAARARASRC